MKQQDAVLPKLLLLSVDAIAGIMQAKVISSYFANLPSSTYTNGDNHCL